MNNTTLLQELIDYAQKAGNALRSEHFDEAEDCINDVVLLAETIAQPQLTRGAKYAMDCFKDGFGDSADLTLRNLIVKADQLIGQI